MRQKLSLLVVVFFVCLFSAQAQNKLTVSESESQAVLQEKAAEISLKIENRRNVFRGQVVLELLDIGGAVRAKTAQNVQIGNGMGTHKIVLPLGDLMQKAQDEIAWYRLHYSIKDESGNLQTEGIISLSEIIKDIFDLRLAASEQIFAGMNYRVRVRALHPFTKLPVKNIKIKGELTLSVDSEKDEDELKINGKSTTGADGFAFLEFKIPPDAKLDDDGEIKITGEKYGIVREIEEDLDALSDNGGVYINTDKPLYQPGQNLNARGLLMKGLQGNTTIISDAELEFSIEDEDDTLLYRQKVKTSAFGIASVSWQIPENAKLGTYQIRIEDEDGESVGTETFKVSRYDLPQFAVKTKTDRAYYLPSQKTAEVEIRADYLFGKPVTKGKVRLVRESERRWNYSAQKYDVKEEETFEGETDADGKFTAKINLFATHVELEGKSYRRYEDLNFAAYFTDLTTNRTEQRRFDLRVTKEAIHIYFIGETYNRNSSLPLTYYISTFYADGTPASATVSISGKYENETDPKLLAQIKTNAYGAGKFEFSASKNTDLSKDFELKLLAVDNQQQTGTFAEEIDFDDGDKLEVRTEKTIYKPTESVKAEILSTKNDALVYVDLVRDLSVIESRFVQLKNGRAEVKFPFQPNFKGELTIAAYFENSTKDDENYYSDSLVKDSRGIVFPAPKNLTLDAKFSQEIYRPNEEAKINFSVLAPDKTPLESALGIVVFDKAIEERAKTDAEFGGGYRTMFERFYGLMGFSESFGGVTMNDINELDTAKPISPDLQLAAELMLADGDYFPRIFRINDDDSPQARSIFAEYLDKQLAPTETALKNAYTKDFSRPADDDSLRKILGANKIDFDALRDPWGVNYRAKFTIEETNDVADIQSAGADKKFDTKDDFTVLKMSFSYFLPLGKTIDKAVAEYHKNTQQFISDYKTLRGELLKQNVDLDNLRDRWNHPYRLEFGVNQRKLKIVFHSNGANGADEEYAWNTDDFKAWTSEIDYFAETDAQIQKILSRYAAEKKTYPKDDEEFKEVLKTNGIDFAGLKDGYGQNIYLTFAIYSRFSDKVKIENTAKFGQTPTQKTTVEPLTQEVVSIRLRSGGKDFAQGNEDDFDLAVYSGVISETSNAGDKTKPKTVINSGANGAIQGIVKDPTGAVVPGIEVTAKNNETEEEFFGTTDENGEYLIENVPSGKYTVSTSDAKGFKKSVITDVPVRAKAITQAGFTLDVGNTSATVDVTSSGVVTVETSSTGIGNGRGSGDGMGGGGGGEKEKDVSENQLQNSTPRLREYFPETLVWNPELLTDKNGKASLKFRLADNLTTWKFYAIASDKTGKIGVAEKEIKAFQPFFADLEPPKFLTDGDEIYLPTQIRNYTTAKQKVNVSMTKADWFSFLNQANQQIEVAPNDSSNAIFGFKAIAAIAGGKQRVTAIAAKDSDAVEKSVTVRPNGQEIVRTESKFSRETSVFDVNFPANALPKTQKAELKIYPNLFSHVSESVEGLLQRPYGCGEQTVSSTYPNLMILKFKSEPSAVADGLKLAKSALEQKAKKYLQKGYERLLGYQVADGGFSYWGGKDTADVALTAYVLRFLTDAEGFTEVDKTVVERAENWLVKQQKPDGSFTKKYYWENSEDTSRTKLFTSYVARTLAMRAKAETRTSENVKNNAAALQKALLYLKARNSEIDEPYALALYGLALYEAGNAEEAKAIAERLEKMAIAEGNTVYWKLETNTPFYGWGTPGRIETTALVLQLLLKFQVSGSKFQVPDLISKATMFLLKNKDRYGVWYSTQTTINVLDAFLAALAGTKSAAQNDSIQISLNGENLPNITISPDKIEPIIVDLTDKLAPTANRIEIRSASNTALMSQIVASHYIDWKDSDAANQTVNQSRALRLDYKCDRQNAEIMQEIICSVEAERIGFKGYGMLLAEIGLPPGADVSRESLQAAMDADWSLSRYDVLPDRIVLYMWSKAGGTRFNFKFKPRYGINAQTPASTVYDYYNEEAKATVAPLRFEVK